MSKYKAGDRVLVECRITDILDDVYNAETTGGIDVCIGDEQIYSKLDHDFKPGEMVEEFQSEGRWRGAQFIGVSTSSVYPWVTIRNGILRHCKEIRKPELETIELNGKKYREIVE